MICASLRGSARSAGKSFWSLLAAEGRRLTEDLPSGGLIGDGLIGGTSSDLRGASLVECVWEDASLTEGDLSGLTVAESRLSRISAHLATSHPA